MKMEFNESNDLGIKPTAQRMANGWAAVLVFPNGGRQRSALREATYEAATASAAQMLHCRLNYRDGVVQDPAPNTLMVLGPEKEQ